MHTQTNINAAPAAVRFVSASMRKKGAAIPSRYENKALSGMSFVCHSPQRFKFIN